MGGTLRLEPETEFRIGYAVTALLRRMSVPGSLTGHPLMSLQSQLLGYKNSVPFGQQFRVFVSSALRSCRSCGVVYVVIPSGADWADTEFPARDPPGLRVGTALMFGQPASLAG